MLKASIFSFGLISGIYLGINLREKKIHENLTKTYHYYKNNDNQYEKQRLSIEQIYQLYNQNIINVKEFQEIFEKAKELGEGVDELVTQHSSKILESPEFKDVNKSYEYFYNKTK